MSQTEPSAADVVERRGDDLWYWCPGCDCYQRIPIAGSMAWQWNGSLTAPTLTPSILSRGKFVCHSYVRNGRIEFLNDCTHQFAGQSVKMESVDNEHNN